jgi:hypothetical protein
MTVIDSRSMKVVKEQTFDYEVCDSAFHPLGDVFVATGDGHVRILDPLSFQEKHRIHAHTSACNSIDISRDGRCALSFDLF